MSTSLDIAMPKVATRFVQPVTNFYDLPDANSTTISQGLFGELVGVLERKPDFTHVYNLRDGYRGYVPTSSMDEAPFEPTHYVKTRATLIFTQPDIKSPIVLRPLFGSDLGIVEDTNDVFVKTSDGNYALKHHCAPLGEQMSEDIASIAEEHFLGAPYVWGGRSPDGFDCSGLVQMAAFAAGHLIPRDSAQQFEALSESVDFDDRRRGDLVYWPGHVGILLDADRLLHATAHSMLSVIEPLAAVNQRAGAMSGIRRI